MTSRLGTGSSHPSQLLRQAYIMNFAALDKNNMCSPNMQDVTLPNTGEYGFYDMMLTGLPNTRNKVVPCHPVEEIQKNFKQKNEEMNFSTLRKIQGIHAPLKLKMERIAVSKVGHLPCLPSSNLMLDTLTGQDELVDFGDILNGKLLYFINHTNVH